MKNALAITVLFSLNLSVAAQTGRQVATSTPPAPVGQAPVQPAAPGLNAILAELQRTAAAANVDLSKLRIEKWKADDSEKQQMQQFAASLQKNMTMAIPALITDVQTAQGSVSKAFKLYHDLNVAYEILSSLSDAAGAFGKKEEYSPLANDASALDSARQNLSNYIEQAANTLETQQARQPAAAAPKQAQPAQEPKKIVIDDDAPAPKKAIKKKKTVPASNPPSSSSPSPTR